ncbi:uncharacterized protein MYCFIDRAFT_155566 [Pseudocercospora fijiensis CIRAD86]|uniref:Zn(2)-C6 fungal-type domain-containing protein n=1 Tax=Pseudocercospora fijiensis (strain CIRAD86) TaxID=383855 RepID=M3AV73_PSEFD|nr:uncharacterized protein MYCFIDRAFT_155566 [Pseudocercospora fijiensis CIRAD86]EME81382.1 hypothetical protein MYCFIDRAFT_155566 [Pseudocercospora fijiensis CIRAD86]
MVYLGRPSRGCQACKTRRIKCDETRPACNNCIKTNRECPGLPEEVDLIFRAEKPGASRKKGKKGKSNTDVAVLETLVDECGEHQKLAKEYESPQPSTSQLDHRYGDVSPASRGSPAGHTADLVEQMSLNPTIEKQATAFFFNNFVLPPRNKETTRGFLELAVPLFNASKEGSPLHLATEAVSVSIIANWPGRRHLQQKSARLYGQALAATQKALQDPAEATSDTTLLAILMFSLYESVTSSERSVQAWAKHIEGAVAIVRARGPQQFANPQSLLLFRAVRTQMLTNAIQQCRDIPDFPGAKGWAGDIGEDQNAASTLIKYSVRLPTLLTKAKPLFLSEKTPQTIAQVTEMLVEAFEIQRGLLDWEQQIPAQWGYRSIANRRFSAPDVDSIDDVEVWPGPTMHVYKDVHIACIRNNNRVSQILCCSIVIDALKWLNEDPARCTSDERFISARHRLQTLVDEICYSVPFHMYGPDLSENMQAGKKIRNASQAIGGYFLIWPLYTASNMQDIPDIQRRWMRGRLAAISRQYGLDQSGIMTCLNRGRSGANWSPGPEAREHRLSEPSAFTTLTCSSSSSRTSARASPSPE